MNLESDKRLNIQLRLDFSSAPTGEARQAGREDIESLSAVHEPERPANTCSKRVSATSRTAVYGAVRTVVWEGRSCEAPPYPDRSDFVHWPISDLLACRVERRCSMLSGHIQRGIIHTHSKSIHILR